MSMNKLAMFMLANGGGSIKIEGETIKCKERDITSITGDSVYLEAFCFTDGGINPRGFLRTVNYLDVTNVKSTDLTNNSFKIATVPSDVYLSGFQNGVCKYSDGSNTIYVPVMFRFDGQDVYAIFSDTSFLSQTGKKLSFQITTALYCSID